jgi:hypothetical protein
MTSGTGSVDWSERSVQISMRDGSVVLSCDAVKSIAVRRDGLKTAQRLTSDEE